MIEIKGSKFCSLLPQTFATKAAAIEFLSHGEGLFHRKYCCLTLDGEYPKPIVYIAHPVGKTPLASAFNAANWLRWLVKNDPSRIYVAHWIGEVLAFPDATGEAHRDYEASLADDEEVLCKFDEIVLVGGHISKGMQRELDRATQEHKRITDMSQYTYPSDLPEGFFLDPNEETA